MVNFSYQSREHNLNLLKNDSYELLVIGGGITGVGIALQAAASGIKTALIEMQDFAEGTSSRSTKLVHGGIRYLKQFDVEVVADTVQERAVIQQIAPHIPKPDPMLLPLFEEPGASYSLFELQVAMDLYDSLANIQNTDEANQLLTSAQVLEKQPNLQKNHLIGGGSYLDFSNNDSRLVIEIIKQAYSDGAVAVSRVKATGFVYDEDRIAAVQVENQLNGDSFKVQAQVVVNASGPWVDTIRHLDQTSETSPIMRPTKGVHLVVDRKKLSVGQPVYFDSGENDKRMVFVLPRHGKTYFGTTDTDYEGDLSKPKVTQEDVDYLLKIVNRRFPEANLSLSDIESSWAGLRPLIANNADSDYNGGKKHHLSDQAFEQLVTVFDQYRDEKVSRLQVESQLISLLGPKSEAKSSPSSVSRGSDLLMAESGLITIAGGKITDYRKMAEGVMRLVIQELKESDYKLIDSSNYKVSGGKFNPADYDQVMSELMDTAMTAGLSETHALQLAGHFGTNLPLLLDGLNSAKKYAERYNYPIEVALSLIYTLHHEMVYSAVDFFLRRTNYMLFDISAIETLAEPVLQTIRAELTLDEAHLTAQRVELQQSLDNHRLAYLK